LPSDPDEVRSACPAGKRDIEATDEIVFLSIEIRGVGVAVAYPPHKLCVHISPIFEGKAICHFDESGYAGWGEIFKCRCQYKFM